MGFSMLAALGIAIGIHLLILLGTQLDISHDSLPAPEPSLDITLVIPNTIPLETPDLPAQAIPQEPIQETQETPPPATQSPVLDPAPSSKEETSHPLQVDELQNPPPEIPQQPEQTTQPLPTKPQIQVKKVPKKIPAKPSQTVTPKTPEPLVSQPTHKPNLAQLLASTQQEVGRLAAELDQPAPLPSGQPRRKSINASTQEYLYAAYLQAWRKKIERIGNLNYPDAARKNKLVGTLLLQVAIHADGSLQQVRLLRSSGHQVLDDSALQIVRLAAPFAPFPPSMRKEIDILDITRSWQFRSGQGLFTGN